MSGEQKFVKSGDYEEKCKKSEAAFIEFIEICLDEGWSPTKCPEVVRLNLTEFVRTDSRALCLNLVL